MAEVPEENRGPSIGALHEVRAHFSDPDAMQAAVARLETSGFDRADLSLPEAAPRPEEDTPEWGAKAVDTEEDARQTRTLRTSGAATLAGMAAAGVVIASGGAAAPAVAAAVAGAGVAGGLAHGFSRSASRDEQAEREQRAAAGALILSVHTASVAKRAEAEAILREAGGMKVEVLGGGPQPDRYDEAVEQSFPASDPPAASGITGPRAAHPGSRER
ncbi:MAG TPA: hypothetical protein VH855_06210 [Acetobacteraceae bacterium]|jgi:hypothetical protein